MTQEASNKRKTTRLDIADEKIDRDTVQKLGASLQGARTRLPIGGKITKGAHEAGVVESEEILSGKSFSTPATDGGSGSGLCLFQGHGTI